jgi:hypothetical protein
MGCIYKYGLEDHPMCGGISQEDWEYEGYYYSDYRKPCTPMLSCVTVEELPWVDDGENLAAGSRFFIPCS